jgi:hypothetical protein
MSQIYLDMYVSRHIFSVDAHVIRKVKRSFLGWSIMFYFTLLILDDHLYSYILRFFSFHPVTNVENM